MSNQNTLREQYEDALFALLMDNVAIAEGRKSIEENRKLQKSGEAVVSEQTIKRCHKAINRRFQKKNARIASRITWKLLNRAAVVVAAVALLGTVAFAASPTFRNESLHLLTEIFEDEIHIRFAPASDASLFHPNWLPEEFKLVSEQLTKPIMWYEYHDSASHFIKIERFLGEDLSLFVDKEDAVVTSVDVQGFDAMLIEKESTINVVWVDEEQELVLSVCSNGISQEEILQVAENLSYK